MRLQGPVKGRSGVCRDLLTDLRRMRDLGVGCIVCCLDDSELEFLGSPWPEYERATREVGLDVLRYAHVRLVRLPCSSDADWKIGCQRLRVYRRQRRPHSWMNIFPLSLRTIPCKVSLSSFIVEAVLVEQVSLLSVGS